MKNETYIGRFREFVDSDLRVALSCEIDTNIGLFSFGSLDNRLYLHCKPDLIMFETMPSKKDDEITGFYHYVHNKSLWKVKYIIQEYNRPEGFVILELSKLINIDPISIIEKERMKEVWETGKSLQEILKWI